MPGEPIGIGVAANSYSEAKKLAFEFFESWGSSPEWIDLRTTLAKGADNEGLETPRVLEAMEGLKRKAFLCLSEDVCPRCGRVGDIYNEDGGIACRNCLDEVYENEKVL